MRSSLFRSLTRVPAVLLALAALAAAPAQAGLRYEARSTTTTDGQKPQVTHVEAWVDGPHAKIVIGESGHPMMDDGDYLLTRDGGKTVYLVDPEERTYTEWDLAAMLGTLGSLMESMGGLVDMEFSDVEVVKLSEEPGGERLGRPVTHVQYRTRYTVSVKVFGMKRGQSVETIQDLWVSDALDAEALGVWLRTEPPATGMEDLDRLIAAEMEKVDGFPLESVSVSTSTGQKGKRSSTTRMETVVTALEELDVPAATFEIPAGFSQASAPEG